MQDLLQLKTEMKLPFINSGIRLKEGGLDNSIEI